MFDIQLIVIHGNVNIDSDSYTYIYRHNFYIYRKNKLCDIHRNKLCDIHLAKMECFSATFHEDSPQPPTLDRCSASLCYSSSTTVQDITIVQLGCWPDKAVPECFAELHRYTCLCATPLCNDKPPSSSIATPAIFWHILFIVLVTFFVLSVIICIIKIRNWCKVKNEKVYDLRENKIISLTRNYRNIVSPKNSREVVLYEEDPGDYLKQVVVGEQNSEDLTSNENTYSEIEIQSIDYAYNQVEELGSQESLNYANNQVEDYAYNQVEALGSQESLGYQETVFLDTTKFALNVRHMDNARHMNNANLVINNSRSFPSFGCHEVQFNDTGKLADHEHIQEDEDVSSLGYQEVRHDYQEVRHDYQELRHDYQEVHGAAP